MYLFFQVILIILEENEREKVNMLSCIKNNLPFSDGIIELNVKDIKFLKGWSISSVLFSESTYSQIMTIHCPASEVFNTIDNVNIV